MQQNLGGCVARYSITSTVYPESLNSPAPSLHSMTTVRPSAALSHLTTLQVAKGPRDVTCTCSVRSGSGFPSRARGNQTGPGGKRWNVLAAGGPARSGRARATGSPLAVTSTEVVYDLVF